MPQTVTIDEAEEIRNRIKSTVYEFSVRIGFAPTAYYQAVRRGRIGPLMSSQIVRHFARHLLEIRR